MELSPKQQTVEQVKKANRILILGHQNPDGDFLGAAIALSYVLKSLEKDVQVVASDPIPEIFRFLPALDSIKTSLDLVEGKILRIDTEKYPIAGMKYQKHDKSLDIILDAEKNLKFQYVEIINGLPKPELIIVLNSPDVEKIDAAYDKNTELFFEVPVINIDHHPGNEYFGSINLVDLTATSTCEILVALFEALGVKITDPDIATALLAGIIAETGSFRSPQTTPKSLTVAAQLLASGGRQQEIIANLYKMKPMALLKLWGEMLAGIALDATHRFAWTKVAVSALAEKGITEADVFEAADELLSNTPEADTILILCETKKGKIKAKLKGAKGTNVLPIAELFGGSGTARDAEFGVSGKDFSDIEMATLKKIHDFWAKSGQTDDKNVWEVIDQENRDQRTETSMGTDTEKLSVPETKEEIEEVTPEKLSKPKTEKEVEETTETDSSPTTKEEIEETTETDSPKASGEKPAASGDQIANALASIEKEQDTGSFSTIGDVIKKKRTYLKDELTLKPASDDTDIFDEDSE